MGKITYVVEFCEQHPGPNKIVNIIGIDAVVTLVILTQGTHDIWMEVLGVFGVDETCCICELGPIEGFILSAVIGARCSVRWWPKGSTW